MIFLSLNLLSFEFFGLAHPLLHDTKHLSAYEVKNNRCSYEIWNILFLYSRFSIMQMKKYLQKYSLKQCSLNLAPEMYITKEPE